MALASTYYKERQIEISVITESFVFYSIFNSYTDIKVLKGDILYKIVTHTPCFREISKQCLMTT